MVSEVVELRVHGVHGTSPGAMLGVEDREVEQVAGDGLTGIYRTRPGVDLPLRDLADPEAPGRRLPVSVEAYSWGSLTSGVQGVLGWIKRVLWLFLLPFALVNLAYWARLAVGRRDEVDRWGARVVRVAGLLLTITLVVTPCVVAVDMVGWQCYRDQVIGCPHLPSRFDVLADWTAARRLAVASLVPLALLGLLWALSRTTLHRYEDVPDEPARGRVDGEVTAGRVLPESTVDLVLRHPTLWSSRSRTQRLQRVHLAAGIATVVLFTGGHVVATASRADVVPLGVTTALAVLVLLGAVLLTARSHRDDLEYVAPASARPRRRSRDPDQGEGAANLLLSVAGAVCVTHLALLAFWSPHLAEGGDYRGHNVWFICLFVALTGLHLSLFVGGRRPREGDGAGRRRHTAVVALVTVGYVVAVVGVAVLYAHRSYHGPQAVVTALLVSGGCVLLVLWHRRVPGHGAHAWNGAGSSFLLATAVWVAMLFTSAGVVAAADYLNGPERDVNDLAASTPGSEGDPVAYDRFTASGSVALRDATVVLTGGDLVVYRGTIAVGGLTRTADTDDPGPALALGSARLQRPARLDIATDSVRLRDSCVSNGLATGLQGSDGDSGGGSDGTPDAVPDRQCSAESPLYLADGQLSVDSRRLALDPHGTLRLVSLEPPQQPIVVPQVLIWTPMGQLAWLLLAAAAVGICVWRYSRGAGREIRHGVRPPPGATAPPPPVPPLVPDDYAPAVARVRWRAGLAHRSEHVLDVLGGVTSVIALLVLVLSSTGRAPWEVAGWLRPLAGASMYAALLQSVAFVALGSQLRRSDSARKTVGILWDLTTFWPRSAHPLAPPCYAERVVPELLLRVRWVLRSHQHHPHPDGAEPRAARPATVILSGHSQGSLIVAAVASRLSDEELTHVRLITYGSQIRALYGRIFPAVFGSGAIGYALPEAPYDLDRGFPDVPRTDGEPPLPSPPSSSLLARLYAAGGSWVNLVRRTDPIGFRVFADGDVVDTVTAETPPVGAGDPGPRVLGHGSYQHSPEYRTAVAAWTGETPVPVTLGTLDVPPLPRG